MTLTGKVNSRRDKRMAEDTAESVMGVTDVHNQLKIEKQGQEQGQQQGQRRQSRSRQKQSG